MEGNNDDEEPQICTVFSSAPSHQSKTIFDTIAFSIPKKESSVMSPTSPFSEDDCVVAGTTSITAVAGLPLTARTDETLPLGEPETAAGGIEAPPVPLSMFESLSMSYIDPDTSSGSGLSTILSGSGSAFSYGEVRPPPPTESLKLTGASDRGPSTIPTDPLNVTAEGLNEEALKLVLKEIDSLGLNSGLPIVEESVPASESDQESPLPTTNTLFTNAPEVPFPVGVGANPPPLFSMTASADAAPPLSSSLSTKPIDDDAFSAITYSAMDAAYDAWIPTDQTRQVLMTLATAVHAGTYFPDKSHMTTPGIIYKEDLVDKVAVNMSRIFGEAESSKRQILTADSVTQDNNGIRELIKLGCYRSAINLTRRLLTLYGQGPGKIGQFSKHTPHSLQLWMTRIALLIRIREFKIAESEMEAFKDFENPDMYYEYYQDSYGQGRKGSMVPFYFRLIAAELPQYASKLNIESIYKLTSMLRTVQQIMRNISDGISEDGSSVTLDRERRESSSKIWSERELRIYYSLTNAFLLAKDFPNALQHLTTLRGKDSAKKAQLTSAIGRLFLQYGDLSTSQKYFKEAASLRSSETETERVENLVDAALYFIAQGSYSEAFGLLKEALVIQPDNFMITNNMAVCLLYMGKVKESLALMETTVRNNTPQLLQENVILNLSTIYELENSDGFKKNALLKLISEYKGDGINLASLKMPNLI